MKPFALALLCALMGLAAASPASALTLAPDTGAPEGEAPGQEAEKAPRLKDKDEPGPDRTVMYQQGGASGPRGAGEGVKPPPAGKGGGGIIGKMRWVLEQIEEPGQTVSLLAKQEEILEKAWEETSDEKKEKILEFAERARKTQEELPPLLEKVKEGDRQTAPELVAKAKEQLQEVRAVNAELPENQKLDEAMIEEALELATRLEGGIGLADDAQLISEEGKEAFDKLTKTMNVLLKSAELNRSESMEEKLGALNDLVSELTPPAAALPMVVLGDIQRWQGKGADTVLAGLDILDKTVQGGEVSQGEFERLDRMVNDFRQGPFDQDTLKNMAKETLENIPVLGSILKLFE